MSKFVQVQVETKMMVVALDNIASIKSNLMGNAVLTLKEVSNGNNVVIETMSAYSKLITFLDSLN